MVCEIGNQLQELNESNFFQEKTLEMKLCEVESSVFRVQELLRVRPNDFLGLLQASPVIQDTQILRGTEYDTLQYYDNPPTIGFTEIDASFNGDFFTIDGVNSVSNGVFISEPRGFLTAAHSIHPDLRQLARQDDSFRPNFTSHGVLDVTFIRLDNEFIPLSNENRQLISKSTSIVNIISEPEQISGNLVQVVGYDNDGEYSEEYEGLKVRSGVAILITQEMEDAMMEYWIDEEGKDYKEDRRGFYVGKYMYRISEDSYQNGGGLSGSPVYIEGIFVGIHSGATHINGMRFGYFTGINEIKDEVISGTRGG